MHIEVADPKVKGLIPQRLGSIAVYSPTNTQTMSNRQKASYNLPEEYDCSGMTATLGGRYCLLVDNCSATEAPSSVEIEHALTIPPSIVPFKCENCCVDSICKYWGTSVVPMSSPATGAVYQKDGRLQSLSVATYNLEESTKRYCTHIQVQFQTLFLLDLTHPCKRRKPNQQLSTHIHDK